MIIQIGMMVTFKQKDTRIEFLRKYVKVNGEL